MRLAVLNARVSSRDQEREGFSIPAQLKLLREYALKHGFQIVREFIDVETAKCSGRNDAVTQIIRALGESQERGHAAMQEQRQKLEQRGIAEFAAG
ncbi:MAG TPA: recombinase family protein [Terriglobales bacterium]|nr:recombinase family protein [Terriglobales bacterium]